MQCWTAKSYYTAFPDENSKLRINIFDSVRHRRLREAERVGCFRPRVTLADQRGEPRLRGCETKQAKPVHWRGTLLARRIDDDHQSRRAGRKRLSRDLAHDRDRLKDQRPAAARPP